MGQRCRGIFRIFLINFNQHTSSPEQDQNPGAPNYKHASPSHPTFWFTKTAYHIISNTTTPVAYYSGYNLQYNPLPVWFTYAACYLEWQRTRPWQRTSVWTPASGPGIYIISLKVMDHNYKENPDLCSTPSDAFSRKHKDGVHCQKTCVQLRLKYHICFLSLLLLFTAPISRNVKCLSGYSLDDICLQ